MNLPERDEKIFAMREAGASCREIANAFDISRSRVQQIHSKLKDRKDNFDSYPLLKKRLSKRVRSALTKHFGSEDILENPQMIADMSISNLLRIKNIGRKSLKEITIALREAGCVELKW